MSDLPKVFDELRAARDTIDNQSSMAGYLDPLLDNQEHVESFLGESGELDRMTPKEVLERARQTFGPLASCLERAMKPLLGGMSFEEFTEHLQTGDDEAIKTAQDIPTDLSDPVLQHVAQRAFMDVMFGIDDKKLEDARSCIQDHLDRLR
jgi:hypothetical protein